MLTSIFWFTGLLTLTHGVVQFWVSPSGSDSNAGDEGHPFATLHYAQTAMRAALNATALSSDATVTVLPGVYIESAPLVFGAHDSGNGGWRVVWNCTGASLYVGVAVTGWTQDPLRSGVWMTNVTGQFVPPTPIPAPSPPGCGLVEPDWSYNGYDITTVLVSAPNNVSACCEACAAQPGCVFWSLCVNITCGTPSRPVNCYLVSLRSAAIGLIWASSTRCTSFPFYPHAQKTSNAGRTYFGPLRTSGSLPGPPAPPAAWRFGSLVEGRRAGVIARQPNAGSGYLTTLGVSNSDSSLTWPAGSPYFPSAPFDVSNSQVFCNIGEGGRRRRSEYPRLPTRDSRFAAPPSCNRRGLVLRDPLRHGPRLRR
jgi:hypothetical protein